MTHIQLYSHEHILHSPQRATAGFESWNYHPQKPQRVHLPYLLWQMFLWNSKVCCASLNPAPAVPLLHCAVAVSVFLEANNVDCMPSPCSMTTCLRCFEHEEVSTYHSPERKLHCALQDVGSIRYRDSWPWFKKQRDKEPRYMSEHLCRHGQVPITHRRFNVYFMGGSYFTFFTLASFSFSRASLILSALIWASISS